VTSHEPQVQERAAQHYAAIPVTVPMDRLAAAIDEGFPQLFGWLADVAYLIREP